MSSLKTKTKIKTESPAPQAYSNKLKYGMALNTAIMFVGKTQPIAVAGGVETMPVKKPLTKLKSPARGVKRSANKALIFEKI